MTSSYVFKHYQIITSTVMFTIVFGIGCKAKKKRVLISGNAGEEKDLQPGDREFIFFNQINLIF